jgi:hypothetical protein
MNPIKQAIELTDKIKNRLQVDIDDGSRPDQWSMEALVDLADRATAALQSMQGEAEPVAYLDEDGRVVRVSVDGSGDGGFVSPNRAIPDYWRPLYTHPQSPAVEKMKFAVEAVREVLQRSYNNAMPVCCEQGEAGVCCGSPAPDWSENDMFIMDRLGIAEKHLSDVLTASGKGE